jgi:Cupredoxin-like domain
MTLLHSTSPRRDRRFLFIIALLAASAAAAEPPVYRIEIQANRFEPAELHVPAGIRVSLAVRNARQLPSEFESFDLNREKVVPPGASVTVWIGPLSPGRYKIFDDFNSATFGSIVVDANPPAGSQR